MGPGEWIAIVSGMVVIVGGSLAAYIKVVNDISVIKRDIHWMRQTSVRMDKFLNSLRRPGHLEDEPEDSPEDDG